MDSHLELYLVWGTVYFVKNLFPLTTSEIPGLMGLFGGLGQDMSMSDWSICNRWLRPR